MNFPSPDYRVYGRRRTHLLRSRRQALMDELLPQIRLGQNFMTTSGPRWVEIGFGCGEHLAAQAEQNPQVTFLGIEIFINGVSSLLRHVDEKGLSNVVIAIDDARHILDTLPAQSLERVYILFPDPWPKKRHHKRRLIQPLFIEVLAHVLKPGGQLIIATDHEDYQEWISCCLATQNHFVENKGSRQDRNQPPEGWVPTRYEEKALAEGRVPQYFVFFRV